MLGGGGGARTRCHARALVQGAATASAFTSEAECIAVVSRRRRRDRRPLHCRRCQESAAASSELQQRCWGGLSGSASDGLRRIAAGSPAPPERDPGLRRGSDPSQQTLPAGDASHPPHPDAPMQALPSRRCVRRERLVKAKAPNRRRQRRGRRRGRGSRAGRYRLGARPRWPNGGPRSARAAAIWTRPQVRLGAFWCTF